MRHEASSQAAALERLNNLTVAEAESDLLRCCGSARWAAKMTAARPFGTIGSLLKAAERVWEGLNSKDWLEAFGHHPRIGEKNLSGAKFAATGAWAGKEQSGMAAASAEERAEFVRHNEQYERKFGHVFLICATGKTAAQMLEQMRVRIRNDAAAELQKAAREQSMITRLRLERMLSE